MSNRLVCLATVAATFGAGTSAMALEPLRDAYTISTIRAVDITGHRSDDTSTKAGFNVFGSNSVAGASTTIGRFSDAPFIDLTQSTSSTRDVVYSADAVLAYSWRVVGAESTPVLVHITTTGWMKSDIDYTSTDPSQTTPVASEIRSVIAASFDTQLSTSYDQRTYGLQTGGYNFGGTYVEAVSIGTSRSLDVEFSQSFDMWIRPNSENYIRLYASGSYYSNGQFLSDNWREFYSLGAFIDPTITVDSAYSADYTLEQSYIPAAAVPEPASDALLLAGLVALGAAADRRKRRSAQQKRMGTRWLPLPGAQ